MLTEVKRDFWKQMKNSNSIVAAQWKPYCRKSYLVIYVIKQTEAQNTYLCVKKILISFMLKQPFKTYESKSKGDFHVL